MRRRDFLQKSAVTSLGIAFPGVLTLAARPQFSITKKIFITGGGYDLTTIKYLITLTGKENPKICFMPTPVGDSDAYIAKWHEIAKLLPIQPFVQKVFISSNEQQSSFESTLLDMDAIIVTGGNTLNAITLWKAHGIDALFKKAWEKGIVLSGPSAGAICWFEEGLSDSRPQHLTKVEGLGFLKGSNCPHYHSEENRKPTYLSMIAKGEMLPGYACDDNAGLYFEDNILKKVITQKEGDKAYKVTMIDGKAIETVLEPKMVE